jgi:acetolactate synthase-1/2/3 large subunit
VDLDPAQMHKNVTADVAVVGDAAVVLGAVVRALGSTGPVPRTVDPAVRAAIDADAAADAGPWAEIQQVLREAMPPDTVVAGDSSQVTYYGTVHHWSFTPANRLLYPTGYATLGYGLPAAIGAKVADPPRPVVALVGDGAAMFSIQELVTAVEQRLPIPFVVVDNAGYAEIREQMVGRGIEPQAVDLSTPDFPALAISMGAYGVRAGSVAELGAMAADALSADRPTLIHVAV